MQPQIAVSSFFGKVSNCYEQRIDRRRGNQLFIHDANKHCLFHLFIFDVLKEGLNGGEGFHSLIIS